MKREVPVCTSPATMGGYVYPILEDLAQGREFQILKSTLPGDDTDHRILLEQIMADDNTALAYVDAGNVTVVQVENWVRGVDSLSAYGWDVLSGQKTFKRVKTLCRPFRTYARMARKLRVHIVNDTDYTDLDTDLYDEETLERLLDGAFVIAPWIRQECIANVWFPNSGSDGYSVDDFRRKFFYRQVRDTVGWNARIFGDMEFSGIAADDPLRDRTGMLKGEAFVHTGDTLERMKVDIIAARSAFKKEVSLSGHTYVLMEPQAPKFEAVMSDYQTIVDMPGLYRPDQIKEHTKAWMLKGFVDLTNNKPLDFWYQMASPLFGSEGTTYDPQDVGTLTRWNARALVMSGMQITQSPWIFEQLAGSIVSLLRPADKSRLRFPIQCAIRCQVISQSFASMCGEDVDIYPGEARFVEKLESIVVHDQDWLEMYRSHGGCDLDDFFVAYYRTMQNEEEGPVKVIVLVRSPNDIGEYSVFRYVEGDFAPSFTTNGGEEISFPEVPSDPKFWAPRLSEAYEAGLVEYAGLPSENDPSVLPAQQVDQEVYSMADVWWAIENNKASQMCVGANVNARTLWTSTVRQHRPRQLTTLEGCVDAGAQGGCAADTEAVMLEAKEIVKEVVENTTGPISSYIWNTRFSANPTMTAKVLDRLTSEDYLTKLDIYRANYAQDFMEMCRQWAQAHCVNNFGDLPVMQLGVLRAEIAYRLLVQTRISLATQNGMRGITLADWQVVQSPIIAALDRQDTQAERHDIMMALLAACHRHPTSQGRYTDNVVMQPSVFPYMLDALRYYGLAAYLEVDEQTGKINRVWSSEWKLVCDKCGIEHITKNPLQLQAYEHNGRICRECRGV